MLKKTIKYTDYEGVEREEDFYFNLSRAEIIEMEYSIKGGLTKRLEELSKTKEPSEILPIFKEMIAKSYGKKSPDGKRFIKSDDFTAEFFQSEAYSELLVELFSEPEKAAAFLQGITGAPKEAIEEAKARANIQALPTASAK